jgi:hypothetical protein
MYELLWGIDKFQVFLSIERVKGVHSVCKVCVTDSNLTRKIRGDSGTYVYERSA